MAYIERRKLRKKMSYRAIIRLNGHPNVSATFTTWSEAKKWGITGGEKFIMLQKIGIKTSCNHGRN
ncbi:MAG: hypothetical protein AB7T49_04275 [Oligoflexales bacterium]